jgi:hypothetical protein
MVSYKEQFLIKLASTKNVTFNVSCIIVVYLYNSSLFDEFVCKLGLFWHAWAILKRE